MDQEQHSWEQIIKFNFYIYNIYILDCEAS